MTCANEVKREFDAAIMAAVESALNEQAGSDFVALRRRKLPPETVMKMVCCMGGNSLPKELYDYPGTSVAPSSFVEARQKISSMTFYEAFRRFTSSTSMETTMNYKGRRLLGVDGVSIRTYTNPQSISFMPSNTNKRSGYNAYSGVVFLDLLTHIPVDIALSPISRLDELGGALSMLAFNPLPTPSIITADRLYGNSYAFLADLLETPNADFVIRTKQGAGAMKFLRDLPMEEFDIRKQVVLTDSQSQASRDRGEIFISTGSKRGKVNSPNTYVSRFSHPLPYILNLRITRIRLKNGEYETLLSSLSQEEFTAEDLREIYKLRWKIELYFRHIKHDCGLIAMHSKIEDYSRQQIYAAFLFSSAVWKIVNSIVLQQKDSNKHEYAVNIKMATYLVRNFLRDPNADSEKLLHDLTRYIVPIRPDRSYDRQLIPIPMKSFCYRVA